MIKNSLKLYKNHIKNAPDWERFGFVARPPRLELGLLPPEGNVMSTSLRAQQYYFTIAERIRKG